MKRRAFLLSAASVAGLAAGGVWLRRATMAPPSLAALVDDLNSLRGAPVTSTGAWSPFRIFAHLAQSVDYSITGYPQMRSPTFRKTAGRAVFLAFSTAGAMRHDLAAPIPGAPDLPADGPAERGIDTLLEALERFEAHDGPLQPHFAYGALSRDDYRDAHILHVRNHLDEIAGA